MRLHFNDDILAVGYIKELLKDFNLPNIPVWTESTIAYDGNLFIKDNYVVRYDETNNKFIRLRKYIYNRFELNFTTNFKIRSSYYDNDVHVYLGEYLRFLRDYKKLDYMGMYNLFPNKSSEVMMHRTKLRDDSTFVLDTDDDMYSYYAVPVKFNKNYTIAIDSAAPYELATLVYTDNLLNNTNNKAEDDVDILIRKSYKRVMSSKFTKPFIYNTSFDNGEMIKGKLVGDYYHDKEKQLRLIIKLPKRCTSSIVILEGNYCVGGDVIDDIFSPDVVLDQKGMPNNLATRSDLLSYNNGVSYPMSTRLIELLSELPITKEDKIGENIQRVQDTLYRNKRFKGIYGLFNDDTKYDLSMLLMNSNKAKGENVRKTNKIYVSKDNVNWTLSSRQHRVIDDYKDLTGYVDKDVETLLRNRGGYRGF